MANIDRITKVSINLKTGGVRQATFSDLMLIGTFGSPNRVNVITDSDQLLEDNTNFTDMTNTHPIYLAAQVAFSQTPGPTRLYIGRRDALETIADALPAIASANNDWYGFTEVSHSITDLTGAAAWAEANQKLFLTAINDVDVTGTSGEEPATALKSSNFFRTAWWYNPDPLQFPEVAIAVKSFSVQPGGETWANQRLAAVSSPILTETAYLNITAKNGNTFEPFRNISITQNGVTAGGEWIDVIRFRDWLCEEIRVQSFNAFIDNRIPFTDAGIGILRQQMVKALDLGVRRGGIAPRVVDPEDDRKVIPSYTVTVPFASQVPFSEKASRRLTGMKFGARLAGAIHAIEITGDLTYDALG